MISNVSSSNWEEMRSIVESLSNNLANNDPNKPQIDRLSELFNISNKTLTETDTNNTGNESKQPTTADDATIERRLSNLKVADFEKLMDNIENENKTDSTKDTNGPVANPFTELDLEKCMFFIVFNIPKH